jgi:uncharacterized protein YkwD
MRFLFLLATISTVFSLYGQYNMEQHQTALEHFAKEEMIEVLKEAAQRFDQKLNVYRKKNRVQELKHLNQAWLMALNHCIWMRANNKLTHDQKKNTQCFSGITLTQRLQYVQSTADYSSLGENIAIIQLKDDHNTTGAELGRKNRRRFLFNLEKLTST